jgi:hypothetical protein
MNKALISSNFLWPGFCVGIFGIFLLFHNLIGIDISNSIWADNFDPMLLKWIIEWGYHSLFILNDPANFFNANSFFPHANSLAYSDALLSAQLVYSPLRLMGVNEHYAMYGTLSAFTLFGTVMTDYMLRRTGLFSTIERCFIIFAAHFSLLVTSFLGHYQLFGFHLFPSIILAVYLIFRDYNKKDMFLMMLLFSLGFMFSIYMGPMFIMTLLCLLPYFYITFYKTDSSIYNPPRNLFFLILCGLIFSVVLYLIYLQPYFLVSKEFPPQSFDETAVYSAKLGSLLHGYSLNSLFHKPAGGGYSNTGDWERAIFPGYLLLLLSFFGFWIVIFKKKYSNEFLKKVLISSEISYFFLACFIIFFVLSLGPYGPHKIRLPFYYLSELYAGFGSIRAPGRFGMLMGLPLGILGVIGIRAILFNSTSKTFVKWSSIFIFVLFVIESVPRFNILEIPYPDKKLYFEAAKIIKPRSVVIDLPVAGSDHFDTLKRVIAQLNNSLIYQGRLIVGYGGKTTTEHGELIALDQRIQKHRSDFSEILNFSDKVGAEYLLIRINDYDKQTASKIRSFIQRLPASSILLNSTDLILLKF